MSDIFLEEIDRLNRWKAELRGWQILEQQALDNIETYIQLQNELKDQIEDQEETVRQIRFSEHPKSLFRRMLSR